MTLLALFNVGPIELLIVAAAAVLLFGGDLPDVARKAARMVARLRSLTAELTQELTPPPEVRRPSYKVAQLKDELREATRLDIDIPPPPSLTDEPEDPDQDDD